MENINEATAKAKELIQKAEATKAEIIKEIEEYELKREKALQEAGRNLAEGNTGKYIKAKNEAEAYKEKIRFLEDNAENPNFSNMESEIEGLQENVKEISRKANKKVFDIYYKAWVEGTTAEEEAESARTTANWIIQETDKLLNKQYSSTVSRSVYCGMLEPSKNSFRYVDAWKGFRHRKRKESQMKEK